MSLATFPGLSYSFETDQLLQNFQPLSGSRFSADDYQETVQLLLAPSGDFVRGRRE